MFTESAVRLLFKNSACTNDSIIRLVDLSDLVVDICSNNESKRALLCGGKVNWLKVYLLTHRQGFCKPINRAESLNSDPRSGCKCCYLPLIFNSNDQLTLSVSLAKTSRGLNRNQIR